MIIGNINYKASIYLNKDEWKKYECIPYMPKNYPATFLLGSEYRNDMDSMTRQLADVGAKCILVDPYAANVVKDIMLKMRFKDDFKMIENLVQ